MPRKLHFLRLRTDQTIIQTYTSVGLHGLTHKNTECNNVMCIYTNVLQQDTEENTSFVNTPN